MRTPAAIVIASVIIGLAIIGVFAGSYFLGDHYELATTSTRESTLGWRLNKRTGVVVVCALTTRPVVPSGENPFADIERSQERPIDRLKVDCGYE
jgi:hypothetical protein